ncbi:MAG: hypothetical protein WAV41_05225 [Microgenomates group bacterium]
MKKNFWFVFSAMIIASVLLAACGAKPADATLVCSDDICRLTITNSTEDEAKVTFGIDYVAQNADVNRNKVNLNPEGLEWRTVLYMNKDTAYYKLSPGTEITAEWSTHQSGLYRATVNVDGGSGSDGVTQVFSYYESLTTPKVTSSLRTLSCNENGMQLTFNTDDINAGSWGSAIYVNDSKWAIFADPDGTVSHLNLPVPYFNIDPDRINVNTNHWDHYIEVDRDDHKDHPNAVYCSYPYSENN